MSEWVAGSALDAEIAVRVMGLVARRVAFGPLGREVTVFSHPAYPTEVVYSYDERNDAMMYRNGRDESAGFADVLPNFSEEVERAWEVVEMLRPARWLGLSEYRDGWRAIFSSTESRAPLHAKGEADTVALAICRAALAAKTLPPNADAESRSQEVRE